MTDFELRIGPKASSSREEEKAVFSHKVWTRPGYQPPLRASPKKRHRSGDFTMDSAPSSSVSDGSLSLLARMGLGTPSPSRSENPNNANRPEFARRFSAQIGETEAAGESIVTLGKHHVEPKLTCANAAGRNSLASDSLSNEESFENMDICTPEPSQTLNFASQALLECHPSAMSSLHSSPQISSIQHITEEPRPPWSHLPLRDRIAPIVRHNIVLRQSQNQNRPDKTETPVDKKSVDAVVTAEICNSIADSLTAARFQLAERGVAQLAQQNLKSIAGEQDRNQAMTDMNSPTASSTSPIINNPPPEIIPQVPVFRPPPTPNPESTSPRELFAGHQASNSESQAQPLRNDAVEPPRATEPQQLPSVAPSTAITPHQEAIPIPLNPSFFNPAPATHPKPSYTSSDTASHTHPEDSRAMHYNTGSTRRRSPSPNPRPYKRPRSRSPSSPSSHHDRARGRDQVPLSPTSTRREPPPPLSSTSSSTSSHALRVREPHLLPPRPKSPPTGPRKLRFRSTSRPRKSRSPPRRRASDYTTSSYHQSSTTSRQSLSPSRTHGFEPCRDYSSSNLNKEPSDPRRSPTSYKSTSFKHSYPPAPPRERYVTKYELERRAQEAAKREEEERERERNKERQQSSTSAGHKPVDENATSALKHKASTGSEPVDDEASASSTLQASTGKVQAPSSPTLQASGDTTESMDLTSTESSALPADRRSALRQKYLEIKTNLDASTKLVPEEDAQDLQSAESTEADAQEREFSVDTAASDMFAMIVDAEEQEDCPWNSFNDIPGLWIFKQGSSEPDVFEESFEVPLEIIQKRQHKLLKTIARKKSVPIATSTSTAMQETVPAERDTIEPPKVSWKLKCISTEHVDQLQETLSKTTTPKQLLQELAGMQNQWPTNGQLIIEINPVDDKGRNIYAYNLDSALPFLEVKDHIHVGGPNVVRFIQLGDMSRYVFILYATPVMEQRGFRLERNEDGEVCLEKLQLILQSSRLERGSESIIGSVTVRRL
ncbi:hypothetical protein NP233_g6344 [Leucocoprinus birnbaumii]|uniref:Uncharacterized protein n=1 Tax=Leucocoprinus birnbaumii TaxID=56174 RepID=A0AAD5YQ37_9AGAR|nr:hypothetical protein NP233_g6344 [Leucocoprinus birnbaumii]